MKAEIISVGNELLAGTTVNTNTAYLARSLALLGFVVHRQCVVADDEAEIIDAVITASKRSHVTVITGGLGPTEDDLTKESVAKAFGLKLVTDPKTEKEIQARFKQRGQDMPDSNLKQAVIIQGCEVLKNDNGTAPGLYLQTSTQAIVLLPGPPSELEPIFEKEVKPRLSSLSDTFTASASLHVFGIGESALEQKVNDLLYGENPSAALYAKAGEVHIDLVARANTQEEANALLKEKVDALKERVGDCIYSDNGTGMAETVVRLLMKTKTKIAVAESCTGGKMAAAITDIDGVSKIFDFGVAAYSDAAKQSSLAVNSSIIKKYTSVSSATAAEMAKGAREKGNAAIGVGITGVAGPKSDYVNKPVGLVYIAVADKNGVVVKKFNFGKMRSRSDLRNVSVLSAFDMVRRLLLGLEIEDARTFGDIYLADVERKGKPRKKSALAVEKAITTGICVVLALAGLFGMYRVVRARVNESIYHELKVIYKENRSVSPLVERNPDTVAWIAVEDSKLDCVVVNGKDDYYKTHDFKGTQNELGCLYVENNIDVGSNPDNTVIYGTSVAKNAMFGPLLNYTDIKYLENNYLIQFNTGDKEQSYRVVSVFYANSNAEHGDVQTFYNTGSFDAVGSFQEFVVQIKMRSVIDIDTDIVSGDTFLTLVTDAPEWDGARLVVVARQVRAGEWVEMTSAMFTKNMAASYPSKWYEINGTTPSHNEPVERDRWLNWIIENEKNIGNAQQGDSSGGVSSNDTQRDDYVSKNRDGEVVITVVMNGVKVVDTPTEIVSQVVAYEMGNAFSDEAIKAQAVAVASMIRYSYDMTGLPEVHGATPTDRIRTLVGSVINEGVYYDGKIAYTPYFASAARTNSASDVWGLPLPYLKCVESKGDAGTGKDVPLDQNTLKYQLETSFNIKLSDNIKNWIVITATGENGVVKTVSIDGQVETTGLILSQSLSLASPNFTITYKDTGMTFTVKGQGHGVGMSQAGAEYYAQQGMTYKEILNYYYSGTSLGEIVWA